MNLSTSYLFHSIAAVVVDALHKFGIVDHTSRKAISCFVRDGCAANTKAIDVLQSIGFNHVVDMKCISHAASNVGKVLFASCGVSQRFIHLWNNLMNVSPMARKKFKDYSGHGCIRYTSDIRWYYQQETNSQVYKDWDAVCRVVYDGDDFASELRSGLKDQIDDNEFNIRTELALLEDVAIKLAQLCYKQEGDGFLIPTTYDHWNHVMMFLRDCVNGRNRMEHLDAWLLSAFPGNHDDDPDIVPDGYIVTRMNECEKVAGAFSKMKSDSENTNGRLLHTMSVLRACRFFDYSFIGEQTFESLYTMENIDGRPCESGEVYKLLALPIFNIQGNLDDVLEELSNYHTKSRLELQKAEPCGLLEFWKKNSITLPNITKFIKYIGTIAPSSATVERVFSMLASIGDDTPTALADLLKASVMIRFNDTKRNKKCT